MICYRIEDLFGAGMYQVKPRPECIEDMYSPSMNPHPLEDGGLGLKWSRLKNCKEYRFGFETWSHLELWISPYFHELCASQLYLGVYEAKDFILGSHQLVFHKDSRRLRAVPFSSLR